MKKSSVTAALCATALALTMAACSGGSESPTTEPTTGAEATSPPSGGEIRALPEGVLLEDVAAGVRAIIPTWPDMSDQEIAVILNAGCDGLDTTGHPDSGVQAIAAYDINQADAAFGLLTAISSYCPEYSALLGG